MKISRPGSHLPLGSTSKATEIAGAKTPAAKPEKTSAKGTAKSGVEAPKAHASESASRVSDIAADLKAGKIAPNAALDKVIERVLDRQLGSRASATLREKVGAALREVLTDDPLLASKVRSLGRD
jgi:hypothetical protein